VDDFEQVTLSHKKLASLPVVNWFLTRLRLSEILDRYLPADDARLRLAPATVVTLLVRNIELSHEPLYALSEWASSYEPSLLDLESGDLSALNDDRVGRTLDRLFDADRASLLTELVVHMIKEFHLDVSRLHNDSTTVTFHGDYEDALGHERGGQPTPAITHGFNKDHRPDLKQLLCILSADADAAVPIALRYADGNTSDDTTHVTTWNALRKLVGTPSFTYVADSKLCTSEAMNHIHAEGGRFITVMPRTRREDTWFRDYVQDDAPEWTEALRRGGARLGEPDEVWRTYVSRLLSKGGYRIIWVHSTVKAARDAATRQARIEAGLKALEVVAAKLSGPRSRLRTRVAVEEAATSALDRARATRWMTFRVHEEQRETFSQENRGRPGNETRYRKKVTSVFRLEASINAETIAYDAATDGCFPLITDADELAPATVLEFYRYQPNLERRHHMLKGPQLVAPVFIEQPHRIEALLLCHFLAMLTEALMEREIRASMKTFGRTSLPLYPESRDCPSPSAPPPRE
jgi:transposase